MVLNTSPPWHGRCDITIVPGGIWLTAAGPSAAQILDSLRSTSESRPKQAKPLAKPIPVPELNRSVQLAAKPLARGYTGQIEDFQTDYIALLDFLRNDAFTFEELGNTCTTLFFDQAEDRLVAFCSTKCSSLRVTDNRILTLCPSVEIAILCVDNRYRYKGIGQGIIQYLKTTIAALRRSVGVQLITLFAVPDAIDFYLLCGFSKVGKGMKILKEPIHQDCTPMYFALPKIDIEARKLIKKQKPGSGISP